MKNVFLSFFLLFFSCQIFAESSVWNTSDEDWTNPMVLTTYYLDSDGDGFGDPNNTMESEEPSPPTGYAISGNDCDDDDDTIGDDFTASISGNLGFCPSGGTTDLTASGGVGYSWLWSPGGEITQTITVGSVGNYSVTVTSPLGCIDDEMVSVLEYPMPQAFANIQDDSGNSMDLVICAFDVPQNSVFALQGPNENNVAYSWSAAPPIINFSNDQVSFTGAVAENTTANPINVNITLVAVDTTTGCSDFNVSQIVANREVMVDQIIRTENSGTPDDGGVCFGDDITFDATMIHPGNYTYSWSMDASGTPVESTTNPWTTSPPYDGQNTPYFLRVEDEFGCVDFQGAENITSAKGITEIIASLTYFPDCENGDELEFTFSGGNSTTYLILDEGGNGISANTPSPFTIPVFVNPGTDSMFTFSVRDAGGCEQTATLLVSAPADSDGDLIRDDCDNCPNDPNKIAPGDCGCDIADTDTDGDGTADCNDLCVNDPLKIAPGDCGCDVADTDTDGDGTADCNDLCINDPNKTAPGDCGCDVADTDTDGDGTPDCNDLCINDPNKIAPGDCGCDIADEDLDNDNISDCIDSCPGDPTNTCNDCNDPCYVENGTSTPCQTFIDTDNDGTCDVNDSCPNDVNKIAPGDCGCDVADTDTDGDGTPDCNDLCVNDPNKTAPGDCGCDVADTDTDGDGTPDCNDLCVNDPNKTAPGDCGCDNVDEDLDNDNISDCIDSCPGDPTNTCNDCNDPCYAENGTSTPCQTFIDTDNDGTCDVNDGCPNDVNKTAPGDCGCDVADTDTDGDGTPDCNDLCANDPLKIAPGDCGCGNIDDADGDGYSGCIDDCDDNNPNINPGTSEICGDGYDNNCDNSIDENCSGYCASSGQNSSQEWIKKVKYGGFNNNSGNDGGYADYTNITAYIDAGQSEIIQLKPQGNRKEWWKVWIDLNQDGDFDDADELVLQTAGYWQRTATIIIPFSATAGLTQMRVSMKRNSYASDPCAIFSNGEVEDYSVDILVPPCGNLNSAWIGEDIGSVNIQGYECYAQSTNEYTVASSGRDIFGQNDKFRFVSTSLCGDGEIIAEVTGMTNTGSYALAGVMMRATTASNSKYAGNFQRPNGKFVFQRRKYTNGYTASGNTWGGGKTWVRLVRIGNTFTGYISSDGSSWTPTYYTVVSMPNCIEAGLAVSSYNAWKLNVSDFANVSVFPITNIGTAVQDLAAFEQTETFGQESLEDRETKISGLNAYKEQVRVRLDWFTGQEYLNDFFEIEKSTDSLSFEKIGAVKGQEFASDAEGYYFYDESPDFGLNYYRIKQIGIEGDEKYSEIREVNFNMNLESLNVFPNPADQEVFVFDERLIGIPGEIELIDGNGIELQRFEFEEMPSDPFRIDLQGLSDGLYFIRVEAEGFRQLSKMFMIARK